jgi:hypothetical protein
MDRGESDRLLALLNKSIKLAGRSHRSVERDLGWSQGYLASLFKGRIQLRVEHVVDIAQVLEVEPAAFLLQVSPPKDPSQLLELLGINTRGSIPAPVPYLPPNLPLPTREEIRRIVQEEMSRAEPAEEPADGNEEKVEEEDERSAQD